VRPDERAVGVVFSCAVFSDLLGSRKSSENTADLSVFRQEDSRGTPPLASKILPGTLRKPKRGEKSAVIVERLVRVQRSVMGCERFDRDSARAAEMILQRAGRLDAEFWLP
jgi:hypothetical protein